MTHKRTFLPLLLMLSLPAIPWMCRTRPMQFAAATLLLVFSASLAVPWMHPHYLAPVAPVLFLLVVRGLRHVRTWRWGDRPRGRHRVPVFVALYVAAFAFNLWTYAHEEPDQWQWHRARLLAELQQTAERHLVLVQYGPDHCLDAEWVYNEADIDRAAVVWARDMSPDQNRELMEYYRDRRTWRLFADRQPPQLVPMTGP